MKDHEGGTRGFYRSSKAYYAMADRDVEIMFGIYYPRDGGGTSGEMAMRWHELSGGLVPRLEVYCDAWSALQQFRDVLETLAEHDSEDITEEQFALILQEHGVTDLTEYKRPDSERVVLLRRLKELEEEKRELEEQLGRFA